MRFNATEIARFLCVGVFNTFFGLAVIYSLKFFLGYADVPANAVGYFFGILASFLLNKNWTFRHEGGDVVVLGKFLLVCLVAYLANLMVVWSAIRSGMDSYLAQLLGVPAYTMASYLGMKMFAFARK